MLVVLYSVLSSAAVLAWLVGDNEFDRSAWVAIGCVVALSVVLGRLLPAWGFAGPVLVALVWLVVILVDIPDSGSLGRAALTLLVLATIAAEAGVLLGSLSAAWRWTSRRESPAGDG